MGDYSRFSRDSFNAALSNVDWNALLDKKPCNVAHEEATATDVLTTFLRLMRFITEQTHGNMEAICFI